MKKIGRFRPLRPEGLLSRGRSSKIPRMNDVRVPVAVASLPGKEAPSFPALPVCAQASEIPIFNHKKKKTFVDETTGGSPRDRHSNDSMQGSSLAP